MALEVALRDYVYATMTDDASIDDGEATIDDGDATIDNANAHTARECPDVFFSPSRPFFPPEIKKNTAGSRD